MRRLILASGSPRRREILGGAGFEFEVITSDADENIELCKPNEMVMQLATRKAEAVAKTFSGDFVAVGTDTFSGDFAIVGADTLVFLDDEHLGKPTDEECERDFLKRMSGREHSVITGVCIVYNEGDCLKHVTFSQETKVHVAKLSDAEIDEYIATGEWTDKAGGYAIQGRFAKHISGIEGEYYNVVGFPLAAFYKRYKEIIND